MTDIREPLKTTKTKDSFTQWLGNQGQKAKTAWAVVVILAGLLGYNVTIEQKIDNQQSVDNITEVVDESVTKSITAINEEWQKRLDLVEQNLEQLKNKKPKVVVQ